MQQDQDVHLTMSRPVFFQPKVSIWRQVERFGRFFFVYNFDANLKTNGFQAILNWKVFPGEIPRTPGALFKAR